MLDSAYTKGLAHGLCKDLGILAGIEGEQHVMQAVLVQTGHTCS